MLARWISVMAIVALAAIMIAAGVLHVVNPVPFISIVPHFLPDPARLVLVSGVFEILGGIGLLVPQTRKPASLGLIALYTAVFPANINMALNDTPLGGHHFAHWLLWLRLPFQLVLIYWAWWCGNKKILPKTTRPQ
jgi:uncharacterized membrane protein